MDPIVISNGKASMTMKSSTSQGELRNSWVMNQAVRLTAGMREICHRPSSTPANVPMAMVRKLIRMLSAKPLVTRSGSQRHRASMAWAAV